MPTKQRQNFQTIEVSDFCLMFFTVVSNDEKSFKIMTGTSQCPTESLKRIIYTTTKCAEHGAENG